MARRARQRTRSRQKNKSCLRRKTDANHSTCLGAHDRPPRRIAQPDLELVAVPRDESFKVWSHGYPYRTVRWHFHHLPHNWVSNVVHGERIDERCLILIDQ